MEKMRDYDIEFIKLKLGEHKFEYHLNSEFFKAFNSSLSAEDIQVDLLFQKSNNMFTLTFELKGKVETDCDRCLSPIQLPIESEHTVIVKVTEYPIESEDDLIYIGAHEYKINIAQHLYDFVNLSLPIKKTCSDVGKTCDPSVTANITSTIDVDNGDSMPERDTDEDEE